MKKVLSIVFMLVLTLTMQAQEDYSIPVKFRGKAPSISDFVKALSRQEDPGELLYNIAKGKKKRKKDGKDYIMYYDHDGYDRFVFTDTTEFCSWDYSDGHRKMVVMIHRDYTNGEIAAGQYSGLSLCTYDAHPRRMEFTSDYNLGLEPPEINGLYVYTLSAKDRTITISVNNPDEGCGSITYRWDGTRFNIADK